MGGGDWGGGGGVPNKMTHLLPPPLIPPIYLSNPSCHHAFSSPSRTARDDKHGNMRLSFIPVSCTYLLLLLRAMQESLFKTQILYVLQVCKSDLYYTVTR